MGNHVIFASPRKESEGPSSLYDSSLIAQPASFVLFTQQKESGTQQRLSLVGKGPKLKTITQKEVATALVGTSKQYI